MSHKKQPFYPPPALPRTGVESHAHLNGKSFAQDLEEVLERATAAGVAQIMQVFLSVRAWEQGRERFAAHPGVFFLLGVHPTEAHEAANGELEGIRAAVKADPRIRAIGEIGLDFYWKDCPRDTQERMFAAQLDLARDCGLPVVIHSRDAAEETFALLTKSGFAGYPLLWHCFGGDTALALRIVEAGWHLSVPGPVTYPANAALREAVASVPLDRLMVETDCPYLSPIPLRGKRNEPANLGYTIDAMASARNMPVEELWTACGDNARRFFGLPPL